MLKWAGVVMFYTEVNTTNYIERGYSEADSRSDGQQILLFLKANVSCVLQNPRLYFEVGHKIHLTVLLPAKRRYFDIIAIATSRFSRLFLSSIFPDCTSVIVESWRSSTPSCLPVAYEFASRARFFLFNLITLTLFTYKLLNAVLCVLIHTQYLVCEGVFFSTRFSNTHTFFPSSKKIRLTSIQPWDKVTSTTHRGKEGRIYVSCPKQWLSSWSQTLG